MSRHADTIRATIACGGSASAIAASWRRCLYVHRLDPDRTDPPRADLLALRRSRTRDADLIASAGPCLDQLFALLAQNDCAAIVADREGHMIECRTNRTSDAWGRKPEDWLGTCCMEAALGTNSIGTCLAEQRGVIVRGEQHFLTRYTSRVGISTPLFGPDGTLIGCLNLNQCAQAHDARLDNFLSIAISNFARRIETELFAQAYPSSRVVLAPPGGRLDALLAVDADDRVIGATRGARRLLELGDHAIARAPAMSEIFPSPSRRHDLADAERRTIFRALARFDGNHSAAAKAIGISRSTLYRKLKSYEGPVPSIVNPTLLKPLSSA